MTTTTVTTEAATRVASGVAWLDANVPGWESRITLPEFDIASTCNCVIGQIFADEADQWNQGLVFSTYSGWGVGMRKALGADHSVENSCAFATSHGFDMGRGVGYDELQVEWERVLRERATA